jgi:NTP pyrophosphatase (non-canonical NTP hydrolase)
MTDHAKTKALSDVIAEMNNQDAKWGADRDQHPFLWQVILGEEFGEVCQAILHDEFGGSHAGTARDELVQVAAVALQFIEQYDRLQSEVKDDSTSS